MMLDYYLFVTYIFILLCVIVILCKYLFADVKRQRRMLDDKEKQLFDMYRILEETMDEHLTSISEAKKTIDEKYYELKASEPAQQTGKITKIPLSINYTIPPEPYNPNQIGFDNLLEEAAENASRVTTLHEKIMEMSKQGMPRAEIAKQLKITQTEVSLVTEMRRGGGVSGIAVGEVS